MHPAEFWHRGEGPPAPFGIRAAALVGLALFVLGAAAGVVLPAGGAGTGHRVEVHVRAAGGGAIANAVAYARRAGAPEPSSAAASRRPGPRVTVAQIDKMFVPYVTAIRAGTAVDFPNHDDVLHNVYSFSPAKQFQLPLYRGDPPHPVIFDRPGVVAIGCNIHDWMLAYIYVTETPFFGVTDDRGRAVLTLPAGSYRVSVWHPRLAQAPATLERDRVVPPAHAGAVEFTLELEPEWRSTRLPPPGG